MRIPYAFSPKMRKSLDKLTRSFPITNFFS